MKKSLIGIVLFAVMIQVNVYAEVPPVKYLQVIQGQGEVMAISELESEKGIIYVAMAKYQNYYFITYCRFDGERYFFNEKDILEVLVYLPEGFKTLWIKPTER